MNTFNVEIVRMHTKTNGKHLHVCKCKHTVSKSYWTREYDDNKYVVLFVLCKHPIIRIGLSSTIA